MQVPVTLALFLMLVVLLGALLAVHYAHESGAPTGGSGSPTHQSP